jgi:predicted glycosyltransferase
MSFAHQEYRKAVELAKIKKLDLTIVGNHGGGGADRYCKLRHSANRTFELAEVVGHFGPDVAFTFASGRCKGRIRTWHKHVGFNDSPHAEAVARLAVPLASKLHCPWVIPYSAWTGYGIAKKNIRRYRGLDPAAWFKHDETREVEHYKKTILIRLKESKASYLADRKVGTSKLIDDFVTEMWQYANIIALCRYQDQIVEVEARYGNRVQVLKNVVDGTALVQSSPPSSS